MENNWIPCTPVRPSFVEGEYVLYKNGDSFFVGKIKRIVDDGAFVFYHSGDTASKTPFDKLRKIDNSYVIASTLLGGC